MRNSINIIKHFITICRHKAIVLSECTKCGYLWRGLMHDLSKFSFEEFISSAKYFQGTKSPIDAEKATIGYSKAWLHHKGHNKHHWEYWIDFNMYGVIIPNKIPYKYVVEMICDWIAAGKVYNKDEWTFASPINYYNKVRRGRYFHPETEKLIITFLESIRDGGLKEFHKIVWDKKVKRNYESTNS